MLADLRFRLRALFRRRVVEEELDEELRFHLDRSVDKHVAAGLSPEEARRRARLELGGLDATKEEARDARGTRLVDDLVQDVRHGVRVLARAPAFTAAAIVTLALGIGANTAMFSVVSGVLLDALPYQAPEELVRLHGSSAAYRRGSISYPNFRDWQAASASFQAMALSRPSAYTLTGTGGGERITGEMVTADWFTVLRVAPIAGRSLLAADDVPGAAPVVLLGERLWQRRYGGAREVVGQTVLLDGKPHTVVGVMPAAQDLRALSGGQPADVYVPLGQWQNDALKSRSAGLGMHGIGRLRPGTTVERAREDLGAVTRSLAAAHPDTNKGLGAAVVPLDESVVGAVRPILVVLFAAVALVLLIACVNVANLLLARSAARARELAIRLALGASVGRLVKQLLTESLLIALAGGTVAVLVAAWGLEALRAVLPGTLPRADAVHLDGRVLLFTSAVTLGAGLLSGLLPALRATRPVLADTLKSGGRGAGNVRHRAQAVFVVVEVAMALVLLVGAGLLVRTLDRLWSNDPGFRPDGVVTFGVSLAPRVAAAGPAVVRTELARLDAAVAATPGVEASALSAGGVPIEADDQALFWVDGRPEPAGQAEMSLGMRSVVGPGYLATMGMTLRSGRFFTARDDATAAPVVVVDEVFARTHFPGEDAVGKRLRIDDFDFVPAEIIGVVGHVKQWGLDRDETMPVRAQFYEAFAQLPDPLVTRTASSVTVLVRARGEVLPALRETVGALDRDNAFFRARSAEEIVSRFQATRRFSMYVLAGFAGLALVLACVGIYGVVSYMVAQRTMEIGVRVALGASAGAIFALVLRRALGLALAGVALGLVAAALLTRFLGDLVHGVSALDPATFAAVALAVTVVAAAATLLPARRATRMDPMQALRHD